MTAFAKKYDAENSSGLVAWLIAAAHYEQYRDTFREKPAQTFFTEHKRKSDISRAFERYVSANHSVFDELDYLEGMQYFALVFYLVKKRTDACRALGQVVGFSREAWRNESRSPEEYYSRARRWFGV